MAIVLEVQSLARLLRLEGGGMPMSTGRNVGWATVARMTAHLEVLVVGRGTVVARPELGRSAYTSRSRGSSRTESTRSVPINQPSLEDSVADDLGQEAVSVVAGHVARHRLTLPASST